MKYGDRSCISIITPTYNHAAWLPQCVESVLAQTHTNWEMLIVDDGSEDNTADVLQPYLADSRIHYFPRKHQGIWHLVDNYNFALSRSPGDYIAILEGDDFWPTDKLARQLPSFGDESVGISYGKVLVANETGNLIQEDIMRIQDWQPPRNSFQADSPLPFLRDLLLLRGNVGAVSLMFRKSSLLEVGGFHQDANFPAVDFSTLLRVATVARATFIDHLLGMWRKHQGQTTEKHNLDYVLGHTQAALTYFDSLTPEIKQALGISQADILQARRNYVTNAYWLATRVEMANGQWDVARRYAGQMFKWGGLFRKTEALVSIAAARLHLNLNPVIDWAAKTFWGQKLAR